VLGEPPRVLLEHVAREVRAVDVRGRARLLRHRRGDFLAAVADVDHDGAARAVDVALAGPVPQQRTLALLDREHLAAERTVEDVRLGIAIGHWLSAGWSGSARA